MSKALDLLEAFALGQPEMSLGELSGRAGLARSTAHKVLKTLVARGYAAQNPATRRYRLGLRNWQLGNLAVTTLDVREVAKPHLTRLAMLTGEEVTLWVPEQRSVVCVERVASRHPLRTSTQLGEIANPVQLASGRCILAFQPRSEVESLLPSLLSETKSLTDLQEMWDVLTNISTRGWELTDRFVAVQGRGVAAPVLRMDGTSVAAITIAGPSDRLRDDAIAIFVPHLLEVTTQISAELGYISPTGGVGIPTPPQSRKS